MYDSAENSMLWLFVPRSGWSNIHSKIQGVYVYVIMLSLSDAPIRFGGKFSNPRVRKDSHARYIRELYVSVSVCEETEQQHVNARVTYTFYTDKYT